MSSGRRIDDRDLSIIYSEGEWGLAGIREEFLGTTTYPIVQGAIARVPFNGTGIRVTGTIPSRASNDTEQTTTYTIDGNTSNSEIFTAPQLRDQAQLDIFFFQKLDLPYGAHWLTVRHVSGQPFFDYFTIFGEDAGASSSTASPNPTGDSNSNSNGPPVGPIVGGVVGGIAAIVIVVLLVFFIKRKKDKKAEPLVIDEPHSEFGAVQPSWVQPPADHPFSTPALSMYTSGAQSNGYPTSPNAMSTFNRRDTVISAYGAQSSTGHLGPESSYAASTVQSDPTTSRYNKATTNMLTVSNRVEEEGSEPPPPVYTPGPNP